MSTLKKKKNYNYRIGLIMSIVTLVFVLIGIFWTPYDPEGMDAAAKFTGSTLAHPMGCDNFGRDILSRVMTGSRTTFLVAAGTVVLGSVVGILIGAFTGYFGGLLDEILMRIIDAIFAFPNILLALVVIAVLGPGNRNVIIALGIAFVPSFARIVRSEFIRCKEKLIYQALNRNRR